MKNIFTPTCSPVFNDSSANGTDMVQSVKKYSNRLPTQDIIGIFIVGAVLPIALLYEITFVLSFWYATFSEEWLLRCIPVFVIGVNAYLNIFRMVYVGPNGTLSMTTLPSILKPGYKYCHGCNANSPPRAHHCPTCNICIYRRDHHSSFAGVCVGHFNQRFFIGAVANLWIVALICCYWNWNMLWAIALPKLTASQIWHLMLPHMALMFGVISAFQFLSIFTFVSSLTGLVFISYLISAQVFCLWRGQTRIEYLMDVRAYSLDNFFDNVREALGERWPLIFVSPFFDTRLSSDGLSFRVKSRESVNKSTKNF